MAVSREESIGEIIAVRGHVTIHEPGNDVKAARGARFRVGNEIETGFDGACRIALNDDSVITLDSASSMRVDQFSFDAATNRRTAVVQVVKGSCRVVVYKMRTPDSRFRILSETATVDVGDIADVVVRVGKTATEVIVLERAARVSNRSALYVGNVRIQENQKVVIAAKQPPDAPVVISPDERAEILRRMKPF